jgi:putative CocE/NonD family hydrolase
MSGETLRERIQSGINLFRAVAPTVSKAVRRGQVFRPSCRLLPADPNVEMQVDVSIPVEDGFSLTACIFRPKDALAAGTRLPVVMCAHPYDNRIMPALGRTPFGGPPQQYRVIPQAGMPEFSELTSWEAPDPNYWTRHGYAVVNLNLPGCGSSGGPPTLDAEIQAKCFYEAIEWVAAQDWCTGAIGLTGVSFLAISQYHVAACQHYAGPPPALKAISPWEGISNIYRELLNCGGILETGFPDFWWETEVKPVIDVDAFRAAGQQTLAESLAKHPFYDEYWRKMAPKLDEIDVPMLVCASFSDHGLHTDGTFQAFMRAKSQDKWLYTHRTGKWDAYYSPDVMDLTRQFFDCFVKGDSDNGFRDTPRVRLEVRSNRETVHAIHGESTWPPEKTTDRKLFIRPGTDNFSTEPLEAETSASYGATSTGLSFTHTFSEPTELTGYMKAQLWMAVDGAQSSEEPPNDLLVFLALDKLDREGCRVPFYGCVGNREDAVTRGYLAASRRTLDPKASTGVRPVPAHQTDDPVVLGECMRLEISLLPTSVHIEAGESVQLQIASKEILRMPPFRKDDSPSRGRITLFGGGTRDSFLQMPVIGR